MTQKQQDDFFGRMNNATSTSVLKGVCGDEMEFYLYIRNDVIEDVKYYTAGCRNTMNCGYAVAKRAKGRKLMDALLINPAEIIDSGECAPEKGRHCAILAVSALYRAVAAYFMMPQ